MFLSDHLSVNARGHLAVGCHDAVDLARQYGTPLYVLNEDYMRERCREYKEQMAKCYPGESLALFASKALCTMHTARIVAEEGLGADVVSGGEIYTLKKAGFPMEKVFFHGNNKTPDEIALALDSGVGYIVIDHESELYRVDAAAAERGIVQKILFRIKPGIDCHTHEYVKTGQIDCKFGLALETGEAEKILRISASLQHVRTEGIHCHIGSQIFETEPFCEAARRMLDLMNRVRDVLSLHILNLGGGFGIRYGVHDDPPPLNEYLRRLSDTIEKTCRDLDLPLPMLLLEPGRAIVGEAGITLYTVGVVKKIPGIRTYVSVDGGMGDNPRYILYGAKHPAVLANRAAEEPVGPVTIAGKCCESGDLIAEYVPMPEVREGDILAVLCTGAYNYSMASNYNRLPRPAMIALRGEESFPVIRRETWADLTAMDVI